MSLVIWIQGRNRPSVLPFVGILQVNQLQESLLGGVGQLVADGMNPQQAATFAG